jgi:hypothetical protein
MADDIKIKVGVQSDVKAGMGRVSSDISSVMGNVKSALGVIGVGVGFGALISGAKSLIASLGDIQDAADQVDFNTTNYQKLVIVAEEGGIKADQLAASLAKLSKAQSTVGTDKAAQSAFEALGLSIEEVMKLNPEDLLQAVAKGFAATGDKAALFDLFGKGASKLIPTLKELAQGFDAINRDGIISEEDIKKADLFDEKLKSISRQLKSIAVDSAKKVKGWWDDASHALAKAIVYKNELMKTGSFKKAGDAVVFAEAFTKESEKIDDTKAKDQTAQAAKDKTDMEAIAKAKQLSEYKQQQEREASKVAYDLAKESAEADEWLAKATAKAEQDLKDDQRKQMLDDAEVAIQLKKKLLDLDKKNINEVADAQKLADEARRVQLEKIIEDNAFGAQQATDAATPQSWNNFRDKARGDEQSKKDQDRRAAIAQDRIMRGIGTERDFALVDGIRAMENAAKAKKELDQLTKDAYKASVETAASIKLIEKALTQIAGA